MPVPKNTVGIRENGKNNCKIKSSRVRCKAEKEKIYSIFIKNNIIYGLTTSRVCVIIICRYFVVQIFQTYID